MSRRRQNFLLFFWANRFSTTLDLPRLPNLSSGTSPACPSTRTSPSRRATSSASGTCSTRLNRRQLVVGDGQSIFVDIQSAIARAVGAHPESYSSSWNAQLVDALGGAAGLLPGRTPVVSCAENADRLSALLGEDGAGVDEVAALRCPMSLGHLVSLLLFPKPCS